MMKRMVLSCVLLMMAAMPAFSQITVTGEGKVSATPDMATVVLAVVTEDPKATTALEANGASMSKLIKALESLGVTKKELHTDSFQVGPKYTYPKDGEPRLVGYIVRNNLSVTVCQTDTLGRVLDVAVKNNARVEHMSWGFKDPEQLLAKARVAAVLNAKEKATLLANTAGSTLGTLVSMSESAHYQPRSNMYALARMADSAPGASVEAGSQILRVTVNVVWNVGPPVK